MKKNQKFDFPILTPTTKSDIHDELISPKEIVERGLMTKEEWDFVAKKTLEIFDFATKKAKENGLILVDTKFEFGKDESGEIYLADEILTPDSSRYWIEETYESRFEKNEEPENIDKEFLRLWFKNNCDPYNDPELPKAPDDLIAELSSRYIKLYETITGEKFIFPDTNKDINQRIQEELKKL
jgi:phosphoribosylaminoimidazole-succinocarboxamide synthase